MRTIEDYIKEESEGIIFCKIGKSNRTAGRKGNYCPYHNYLGNVITSYNDPFTFERLDDAIKYLHYGDELVIFNFTEAASLLKENAYYDNGLNKGCYQAQKLYVKEILSFRKASTIDFIYQHLQDKTYFYECSNISISQLEESNLFDAANRWKELANVHTATNENIDINRNIDKYISAVTKFFRK